MVELDSNRTVQIPETLTFAQSQFLIGDEGKALYRICARCGEIGFEFFRNLSQCLLSARKIDCHRKPFSVLFCSRILTAIPASERMARIDIRETFVDENLRCEPFRWGLPFRPLS